jgi:hypothetical protein
MYIRFMVFNATFINISVISWRSVHWWKKPQVTDKLDHIMLYISPWVEFQLITTVVIGTDCIGSCKSNYHTITASTTPWFLNCSDCVVFFIFHFIILIMTNLYFFSTCDVYYISVAKYVICIHKRCRDWATWPGLSNASLYSIS